jgi:ATP adenylyltransferase
VRRLFLPFDPCYKLPMQEILWAPWRMSYIEKPTTGSSTAADIFMDLPAESDDRKNLILARGECCFSMLNAYPYATGHLLIAPYRQVSDIVEMFDDELLEVQKMIARGIQCIRRAFKPQGFNIGVNMGRSAGAGIPHHIHWHVVPRWDGDGNFMSVTANTRVLPLSLSDTYERLREFV